MRAYIRWGDKVKEGTWPGRRPVKTIWFLTAGLWAGIKINFRIYSLFPGLPGQFRLAGESQKVRFGTQAERRCLV
jgi:hypothetical protein